MAWIIVNTSNPDLAWNNLNKTWETDDWDTFSELEKAETPLPEDGEWRQVPWSKQE